MQKVYLVKKDPQKEDREDNWTVMDSVEFSRFMSTPEGRARSSSFRVIDSCGCGDSAVVAETGGDLGRKIRSEHDRNTYLRRCSAGPDGPDEYMFIRYREDADQEHEQRGRICSGRESPRPLEDEVVRRMEIEAVRDAVRALEDEERRLVIYCILSAEPMSEKEYGRMTGLTRDQVHMQKRRILRKLRNDIAKRIETME